MTDGFEAAKSRSHNARKEGIKMITETPLFWGSIMLMIGLIAGFILFNGSKPRVNNEFMMSLLMEILSVVAAVGIIDIIRRRQDENRNEENLRKILPLEAGSRDPSTAKKAIELLRHKGLLTGDDGLLQGINLEVAMWNSANLADANLRRANLKGAQLQDRINLIRADLTSADLTNARAALADFRDAVLIQTTLTGTDLSGTDLEGADLSGANLTGCNLSGANLKNANLKGATMNGIQMGRSSAIVNKPKVGYTTRVTILPDGTLYDPQLGWQQLQRFT